MKEQIKRIVVTLLVAGLSSVTAILLSECISVHTLESTASIVFEVCGSIAIIAALIGLYIRNKEADEYRKGVDIGQLDNEIKEYKEQVLKNFESVKRRILRYINWGTVYFWFVYLVLFIGMTATFFIGEDNEFRGFSLLFLFWTYGLNGSICDKFDNSINSIRITESEFPCLTRIVKEVFDECGIKGRIKLHMTHDSDIQVGRRLGVNHVGLGAKAIALLDELELRQALYHEAAHIKNKDTHLSYRLAKGYEKWNNYAESSWGFASIAPVYILSYLYNKEYNLFNMTSSHTIETNAERFVAEIGNHQAAISGLAKVLMFESSLDDYVGDGSCNYFREEKPKKGVYRRDIQSFKEKLPEREASWRKQIENTLLEDISSHPTFSERKTIMGVEDYKISFEEGNIAYETDRERLLDMADQEAYDILCACFEHVREEVYLVPKAKIEDYRAGKLGYDLITKIEIAKLCEDVCLLDEAYVLYEEIRKEDPINATAAYGIGRIKLLRKNNAGIQDIYESLRNHNYTDEKLQLVGDYCVAMGLKEEYDHWLQYKNDKLNFFYNSYDRIDDCWDKEMLSSSDLSPELIERRRREILEIGQGMISRIYLVKKQLSQGYKTNVFLLKPSEGVEEEPWEEMINRVFLLLDNDGEEDVQYGLHCLWENPGLEDIISKVEGTCIFSK